MWGKTALWSLIILFFIVFYPMLVSIYVTLPLFIGFAGYLMLQGIDGKGWRYILFPLFYLLNLEINLSLPILLTLLAVLIYSMFLYPAVLFLKRCQVCVALVSVLAIDLLYFGLILGYDFIFDTRSIEVNSLLLYSLTMDAIAAVLL